MPSKDNGALSVVDHTQCNGRRASVDVCTAPLATVIDRCVRRIAVHGAYALALVRAGILSRNWVRVPV